MIKYDLEHTLTGTFIVRDNRFVATVEVGGEAQKAHVPNSGRMKELLIKGAEVLLSEKNSPHRKTKYQLTAVKRNNIWVNIDSSVPNKLLERAFKEKTLPEFKEYVFLKREIKTGSSRLDFLLENEIDKKKLYVEAKSVTLVKQGTGMFPDAPTERGKKHLEELIELVKQGNRAAVVFIIQRNDAIEFKPNRETDENFASALKKAYQEGVLLISYNCNIKPGEISLLKKTPIKL